MLILCGLLQLTNGFVPVIDIHDTSANQKVSVNLTVQFDPSEVEELLEGDETNVFFNFTPCCESSNLLITITVDDDKVAEITENATIAITDDMISGNLGYGGFRVRGKRLGLAELSFYVHEENADEGADLAYEGYSVIVLRERDVWDDIYRYGIICFAIIIYFGFGCQINLQTIWSICKKPVAPAIGVFCQFVIMPLVSDWLKYMIGVLGHDSELRLNWAGYNLG